MRGLWFTVLPSVISFVYFGKPFIIVKFTVNTSFPDLLGNYFLCGLWQTCMHKSKRLKANIPHNAQAFFWDCAASSFQILGHTGAYLQEEGPHIRWGSVGPWRDKWLPPARGLTTVAFWVEIDFLTNWNIHTHKDNKSGPRFPAVLKVKHR